MSERPPTAFRRGSSLSIDVCENCGNSHAYDSASCQHSVWNAAYENELSDYNAYVKMAIRFCVMMSQPPTLERVFRLVSVAANYEVSKDHIRGAILELLGL